MITIIFETHATSVDNEQHVASGHFDCDLSALGQQQARELGARYAHEQLDAIFCSDLRRASATAELAFAGRGVPIVPDARLRECDYGELTRHPREEVEQERPHRITKPFPGGESYEQASQRVRSFLADLLRLYDGKRVMIIGHRATQCGLEHWIRGILLREAVTGPWTWRPGWRYHLDSL